MALTFVTAPIDAETVSLNAVYRPGNYPRRGRISATLFGRPAKGLTTNLGVTYLDAKYGEGYSIANFRNVVASAESTLIESSQNPQVFHAAFAEALENDCNHYRGHTVSRSQVDRKVLRDGLNEHITPQKEWIERSGRLDNVGYRHRPIGTAHHRSRWYTPSF